MKSTGSSGNIRQLILWMRGVNALIGFTMENRRAVLHIYQSVNRDIFEKHYWKVCDHVVTALVGRRLEEKWFREKSTDVSGLCHVRLLWRYDGMAEQWDEKRYSGVFNWLFGIKQGTLEEMIARCEKK